MTSSTPEYLGKTFWAVRRTLRNLLAVVKMISNALFVSRDRGWNDFFFPSSGPLRRLVSCCELEGVTNIL
jgi:hypothetical protein